MPGTPRRGSDDARSRLGDTPEARRRIARLRRIDALIAGSIKFGGIAIIVAVLAIFVFVAKEALPLFLPTSMKLSGTSMNVDEPSARPLAVGEDEYREKGWVLSSRGRVRLLDFAASNGGKTEGEVPLDGFAESRVTCGARAVGSDMMVAATADGKATVAIVAYEPVYGDGRRTGQTIQVASQIAFQLRKDGGPIDHVAIAGDPSQIVVVGVAKGFLGVAVKRELAPEPKIGESSAALEGREPTALTLSESGDNLILGFRDGSCLRLSLDGVDATPKERLPCGNSEITALAYGFGSETLLVGDRDGHVTGWQGVRSDRGPTRTLTRVRDFGTMKSAITTFAASRRDKKFLVVDKSGNLRLEHITTENRLGELDAEKLALGPVNGIIGPKSDGGVIVSDSGELREWVSDANHPEISLRSLFAPMMYEGYDSPQYVWQSTGGGDDFEPKLSLVPLIFGSLKGVLFAMLFSVPIAILAALFVSQFASTRIRGLVKPTVELMGALPSVVVGFLAGLWLAPLIDRNLMATFLVLCALPIAVIAAGLVFRKLSNPARQRFALGKELWFSLPFLATGVVIAILIARPIEKAFFHGDLRSFLVDALGVAYDARNCVVVGIALGFAVIPIIFTVAEDAMSNVPRALRAASDALGASRWQTAFNLVLPAASPGIFAAFMLGFGRAIGETMIVLMATGNTPILDVSPFNGMRTIAACIAVEIPEAQEGSTHARVLFLAGTLLFLFAFLANTTAEIIGDRLRKRYARW